MRRNVGIMLLVLALALALCLPPVDAKSSKNRAAAKGSRGGGVAVVPGQTAETHDTDSGTRRKSNTKIVPPEQEEQNLFIPTDEWQTVTEGQSVPAGLHVRMDLQTGKKEAKLLSEDADEDKDKTDPLGGAGDRLSFENIQRALKDVPSTQFDDPSPADAVQAKIVQEKYRSYDELKADYAKMGMAVKSDVDMIKDALKLIQNPNELHENKLAALEDLEVLVHQIDNGVNLVQLGGLHQLAVLFNQSAAVRQISVQNEQILVRIAHIIGSAAQSNTRVQYAVTDDGLLQKLMHLFGQSCLGGSGRVLSGRTQNRLLYAIATVTRSFPMAQAQFIRYNGLEIIDSVLQQPNTDADTMRLKLKVITLLSDYLAEYHFHEFSASQGGVRAQYMQLAWPQLIREQFQHWCTLLVDQYYLDYDTQSWDWQDKMLSFLHHMAEQNLCKEILTPRIGKFQVKRTELEKTFTEDQIENEFAGELLIKMDDLLRTINMAKTEL